MGANSVGQVVLQKVVEKLGGLEAAAAHLGFQASIVSRLLKGTVPVPDVILLRAVDVLDEPRQALPESRSPLSRT
jgi:hypothetical protein